MSKHEEFLDKLQALLEEYNASISWTCHSSSDLQGVYDERMEIDVKDETIVTVLNSYVNADNLKESREDG